MNYIGHILSKDCLRPDTKKMDAIMKMTSPDNREELQRFLGMLTYLNTYVSLSLISHVEAPLWALLEKNIGRMINEDLYGTEETSYINISTPIDQLRSLLMPAPKVWVQFYYKIITPLPTHQKLSQIVSKGMPR